MSSFSDNAVIFLIAGVIIASFIGCFTTIMSLRNIHMRSSDEIQQHDSIYQRKTPPKNTDRNAVAILFLFFIIFVVALITLVRFVTIQSISTDSSVSEEQPPISIPTPAVSPLLSTSVPAKQFVRLDELVPIVVKNGNFFMNGWGDGSDFEIDDRTYSHGIGMFFSGTDAEKNVSQENSLEEYTNRSDCREISSEYALRGAYSELIFSVGADSGTVTYFGDKETNGIAQLLFVNVQNDKVLFDTGWVDYSYAAYEKVVDLTNVDIFKIIYRTCGVSTQHKLANPLRFAIVDPILFLKDDAE